MKVERGYNILDNHFICEYGRVEPLDMHEFIKDLESLFIKYGVYCMTPCTNDSGIGFSTQYAEADEMKFTIKGMRIEV